MGRGGAGGYNGGAGGDGGPSGLVRLGIVGLLVVAFLYALGYTAEASGIVKGVLGIIKTVAIIGAVGIVVIILALIAFAWWAAHKKQKNKEAEQMHEILNTPLESFGDLETQQLMDKYDGKTSDSQNAAKKERKGRVNPYSAKKNMYEDGEKMQAGR